MTHVNNTHLVGRKLVFIYQYDWNNLEVGQVLTITEARLSGDPDEDREATQIFVLTDEQDHEYFVTVNAALFGKNPLFKLQD